MITAILGLTRARARVRARIETLGFTGLDDATLCRLDKWLRVAPALTLAWTALALALQSTLLLWLLALVALVGVFDRDHPFDALYNHVVRYRQGERRLPAHRAPRRFAFGVAATLLAVSGWGFAAGAMAVAWWSGATLVAAAALMSVTGMCLPSYVYDAGRRWFRAGCPTATCG